MYGLHTAPDSVKKRKCGGDQHYRDSWFLCALGYSGEKYPLAVPDPGNGHMDDYCGAFHGVFIKEILYIIQAGKEGKMYGIIV